ncbi:unnamed protein product [Gadus morhua 'NCC']
MRKALGGVLAVVKLGQKVNYQTSRRRVGDDRLCKPSGNTRRLEDEAQEGTFSRFSSGGRVVVL